MDDAHTVQDTQPDPADESSIDRWQTARQGLFKSVPRTGKTIRYMGRDFIVFPNTFWPFLDSQPLVESLCVRRGETTLDVGTGSGVIAIFSAYQGAARVVAVDINPDAIMSARHNVQMHGFEDTIEVRLSDLFDSVGDERFDVVTANLPFRNKPAHDIVARSQWDTDFETNRRFFAEVCNYLKPDGRVYFAHASFGDDAEIHRLAGVAGLTVTTLDSVTADEEPGRVFSAHLMERVGAQKV
jgi:release factor glutamine methyltransferase